MADGIGKAILIGAVAGMRCFLAPAIVSANTDRKTCDTPFCSTANTALKAFSIAELIADKTPFAGDRTDLGPLTGRIISGAVCGMIVSRRNGDSPTVGAFAGSLAAFASAHAFYLARKAVNEVTDVPDVAIAVVEDAIATALGDLACQISTE